MAMLRGFALGIDEVRDIFGAAPELAARLRAAAAEAFPAPDPPRRPGLLGWLGPVLKRDDRLIVDPRRPTRADVDTLLAGRFCPPERLVPAWDLLTVWLTSLAFGQATLLASPDQLSELEFSLARVGLPSPLALGTLLANDPQLPLLPPPGTSVGYAKHHHVRAVRAALEERMAELPGTDQDLLRPFLDALSGWDEWQAQAAGLGRPKPDLFVIWQRG
ncbi:MAG: hypothetical protein Q3997_09245 [Propionibacteriaceae bacterium]|nr:hypothetical protein [Propionibacteriaceae bacterium]